MTQLTPHGVSSQGIPNGIAGLAGTPDPLDLDLHRLDTALPTQPHQLGTLVTSEPIDPALIDIGPER